MSPHPFSRQFLVSQWAIAASYSLVISFLILFHKNTPEQSFYSTISISRLLAITLPVLVFMIAIYSIQRSLTDTTNSGHMIAYIFSRPSRIALAQICALIAISIGLLGICLPAYHFGRYAEHYIRIQPLIIWIGIFGLHSLILILFPRRTDLRKRFNELIIENSSILRLSFWVFFSFIALWIFIAKTGMGISGNEDYWYEAGVPILPLQVLISVLAGFLFSRVEKSLVPAKSLKLDRWIFFAIWLIAAFFWGMTPAPDSYFNPGPLPPNNEVYPYSDAAGYDLQSQYALIGQGLKNGKPIDNPMYPAFLVFIHLMSGQDYPANMALQAMVYAVFPAIVYLIGKTLIGRSLGITTAIIATFRGCNSIAAASMINLASPKQMLIDFPTAIGVALSIFTLLILFDKGRENPANAIWHGGAIGFAFLIRPTALVLLGVAPLITFFQRYKYGKRLRIMILILAGFIIFVLPWGIRNTLKGGNAISIYLNKINLVSQARFPETKKHKPDPSSDTSLEQSQAELENKKDPQLTKSLTVTKIILSHFLHNVIGSTLILPTSTVFYDLHHTIKSPTTIWSPLWNGAMNFKEIITLLISLAVLSIGIATAWKSKQMIGLAPLMVFLLYQIGNSIGRTSGGRYIVPVDWIIVLYYSVGLIEIFKIIFQLPITKTINLAPKTSSPSKSMVAVLSLVVIFGSIPLLMELPFSTHYTRVEKETAFTNSSFKDILSQSNYSEAEILNFLKEKNSVLLTGRAMYPRYFGYRAVIDRTEGGIKSVAFPHLEFYLIGPEATHPIVLYRLSSAQLSNVASVFVLGCRQPGQRYINAITVIGVSPEIKTYTDQSDPPLECPLEQPICDNNGNCR